MKSRSRADQQPLTPHTHCTRVERRERRPRSSSIRLSLFTAPSPFLSFLSHESAQSPLKHQTHCEKVVENERERERFQIQIRKSRSVRRRRHRQTDRQTDSACRQSPASSCACFGCSSRRRTCTLVVRSGPACFNRLSSLPSAAAVFMTYPLIILQFRHMIHHQDCCLCT